MMLVILSIALLGCVSNLAFAQTIAWNEAQWDISAQGHVIDQYQGAEALYLKNGIALLKGADYQDFIVEFDLYLQERRSFSGIIFRVANDKNYEEIYFRGHLSGMPDAMQYTPVFGGNSSWQLYHSQAEPVFDGSMSWQVDSTNGYNAAYDYPFGDWMHVALEVKGTRAKLRLDGRQVLTIKELKRGISSGTIGFKSGRGAVHFANVQIRPLSSESEGAQKVEIDPGMIANWQISSAFNDSLISVEINDTFLKDLSWDILSVEKNGLANISRIRERNRSLNTVLARCQIKTDLAQVVPFRFGYSDGVTVFLNGKKLYACNNAYRSRDYRYLGTIGLFDELFLSLQPGNNELILAVSEIFGGWGIMGQLESKVSPLEVQ